MRHAAAAPSPSPSPSSLSFGAIRSSSSNSSSWCRPFSAQRPAIRSRVSRCSRPNAAAAAARAEMTGGSGSGGAAKDEMKQKTGVLFVCLGNICRSPTAEAVFRRAVEDAGAASKFDIDSCGTGGGSSNWYLPGGYSYHEGDEADQRMAAAARRRNVALTSRSRPLVPDDLRRFDRIVAMDGSNVKAILRAAEHWAGSGATDVPLEEVRQKTVLMTDFCRTFTGQREVPDPYYGGAAGFERVLDLLDDACGGLLADLSSGGGGGGK